MPKVGMEPVRRHQLINATIEVVAEVGLHATTINRISKKAGLSSGIISHYFGGKHELIEATVRHLLDELKSGLLANIEQRAVSPVERLMAIVDTNFSPFQRGHAATKTWLAFWAQSMHDESLSRLQRVNHQRLESNLRFSFAKLMPRQQAKEAAELIAALIDGFWLRAALSPEPEAMFDTAASKCKAYVMKCVGAS